MKLLKSSVRGKNIDKNGEKKEMLKNPQLYRVYWWHVILRLALEVGFLIGQYLLYGFLVPELYQCRSWPCPHVTDCFVSRPMEKTCLLLLMYGLGGFSCLLSILEIFVLGWERLKFAFCCRGPKRTYEEKRRILAAFADSRSPHRPQKTETSSEPWTNRKNLLYVDSPLKSKLDYESMSSCSTINSI